MALNDWIYNRIIWNTAKLEFSSVSNYRNKRSFESMGEIWLLPKSCLENFSVRCRHSYSWHQPSQCPRWVHKGFVCSFLCTDSVLKEGKIIFILEAVKAANLKCFSLHTTTKKVLKGNYKTAYLFDAIKIYNIAVLSLKQYLSIYRRYGPEVLPQLAYCKFNNGVAVLDCAQRTSEYNYF